jgi:branched-chain amino acid transport system substrate-binding protein
VAAAFTVALLVATLAACTEDRSVASGARNGTAPPGATAPGGCGSFATPGAGAGVDLLACARPTTIGQFVPAQPQRATGEPITIGMINQENTPAGSFPELSQAVRAGLEFINEQLGGVDGRPLQLEVCNTKFSAEGSTACAQQLVQSGVPVVLGGIDVFGNGIETLEANGVPFVGGIPVSYQSVKAKTSFQWSGGIWGATVAFADYSAKVKKAKSAAIVYGEFGPITDGANYGKTTLERHGVTNVQLVPHPIIATDLNAPIQVAAASNPDVIFLLEADTGCKGAYDAVHNTGVKATVFYVGACAAPTIVEQAGTDKTNGAVYNVEGPIDPNQPNPDTLLYTAVIDRYGKGLAAASAGTVSFRSLMNLYVVLRELGKDGITREAVIKALSGKVEAPSFMGHPYTCDGKQIFGLPAICSPQEILVEMRDGQLRQLGGWIDVGRTYEGR